RFQRGDRQSRTRLFRQDVRFEQRIKLGVELFQLSFQSPVGQLYSFEIVDGAAMQAAHNLQFVFQAADMILDGVDRSQREFGGFQIRQGNVDFHLVGHGGSPPLVGIHHQWQMVNFWFQLNPYLEFTDAL